MNNFETFVTNFIIFKEKYGSVKIPVRYRSEDGTKLGLLAYRIRKGDFELSGDEIERLNEIGFPWVIENSRTSFETIYDALVKFKKQYGHCNVQQSFVTENGLNLGIFIKNIKSGSRKINEEQKKKLMELGFVFEKRDPVVVHKESFEEFLKELQLYKAKYGDCLVPVKYRSASGVNLGERVMNIRAGNFKVTSAEKRKLDEIGFVWRIRERRKHFDEVFYYIQRYVEEHGDCLIPTGYVTPEGIKLGLCVRNIRANDFTLNDEQRLKLNKLGFVWRVEGARKNFSEIYKLLIEYKNEFGNCKVPIDYITPDGVELGVIVENIKTGVYKFHTKQARKLKELQIQKYSSHMSFDEVYKYLKKYFEENGHSCVPTKFVTEDGINLGIRVKILRTRKNILTEEQKKLLDDINFVWRVIPIRKTFDEIYELLKEYRAQNGHCCIPANYVVQDYALGRVACKIRRGEKKITKEQSELLRKIDFV